MNGLIHENSVWLLYTNIIRVQKTYLKRILILKRIIFKNIKK